MKDYKGGNKYLGLVPLIWYVEAQAHNEFVAVDIGRMENKNILIKSKYRWIKGMKPVKPEFTKLDDSPIKSKFINDIQIWKLLSYN